MIEAGTIDAIVAELSPLRQRCGDPRPRIREALHVARTARTAHWPTAASVRHRARKAQRAIDIAAKAGVPAEATAGLERHAILIDATGPDARFNYCAWICAFESRLVVERFSRKPATTVQGGVVHNISQIIFASASGESETKKTSLLKAVRAAMAYER